MHWQNWRKFRYTRFCSYVAHCNNLHHSLCEIFVIKKFSYARFCTKIECYKNVTMVRDRRYENYLIRKFNICELQYPGLRLAM